LTPKNKQVTLKYGLNWSMGGSPNKMFFLTQMEKFLNHWSRYAEKNRLNKFKIFGVEGVCIQIFTDLSKSFEDISNEKYDIKFF
jgi:hypothetical protein